jgi:hypothetical protein
MFVWICAFILARSTNSLLYKGCYCNHLISEDCGQFVVHREGNVIKAFLINAGARECMHSSYGVFSAIVSLPQKQHDLLVKVCAA